MKRLALFILHFSFFILHSSAQTLPDDGSAEKAYIIVESDTVLLPNTASRTSFTALSNTPVTLTTDAPWLSIEEDATGHYILIVEASEGERREAALSIAASGVSREVTVIQSEPYTIYENNFNTGTSYAPFRAGWAWSPNYIKVVDKCLEFYYNQEALDNDNRRERRGAEIVCDFTTNRDGWYGFRIFLPEGKFPKDIDNSIFCQIFNSGPGNTWAAHLSLSKDKVILSHRYASINPTTATVGTVTWDTWIPVVVYFKAGLNNKGRIRVWMGDDMVESRPTYDTGPIRFGFGTWIDDETMNNVASDDNPKPTSLGPKLGLYVSSGGDRTIRFDDIKLLEGNPVGAFNIVRPR